MEEIVTFKADVLLFDGVLIRKQGKILIHIFNNYSPSKDRNNKIPKSKDI